MINSNSIKSFREKLGLTQQELADALSIERSTVTKWETGMAMPRASKLPDIAEILHCQINDLYVTIEEAKDKAGA